MHWADKLANQIVKSGKYEPYWVDDMKTPSGRVHIGSVRAFLTHAFVYMALKDKGVDVHFSYVLEDHDPFDKLPTYIDEGFFRKYLGMPLYRVPSPEEGYESYGHRWGSEYMDIFKYLGVDVEVIWGSKLYLSGKMNEVMKECLDNTGEIRIIYKELYEQEKPAEWLPISMVCEQCGKLATTEAYTWDGEKVHYRCVKNKVEWTEGCGFEGKRSPFDGNSKLPWKVEWPCKWKVVGITVEGAGKDHMSDGGSHDFAKLVCEKVLGYQVPFAFSHEFFLIGGRKMSSSKGVGVSATRFAEVMPAYVIRYIVARVKYSVAVDLDPKGMTIPDLFDGFDDAVRMYWENPEDDLARVFELSRMNDIYDKKMFLPRFRDVANYLQDPKVDVQTKFVKEKGLALTDPEKQVLEERIKYAKIWLADYAPDDFVFRIREKLPEEVKKLSAEQIDYLKRVSKLLSGDVPEPEELQQSLYNLSKVAGLPAKKAFEAIYTALLGKKHGPKAAWMISEDLEKVREILKEVGKVDFKSGVDTSQVDRKLGGKNISISSDLADHYPSVSVGYALIKGIKIGENDPELEKEKEKLLAGLSGLTVEKLGKYPEVLSYRELYKQMRVKYQSRRPSPEALLRRVTQGKDLYKINTCVDAYNLVVMRNRVSVGAFDADKINFPCELKIADGGEEILLLGENKKFVLKAGEISYCDQIGPYNLDFNYRDAQRTAVSEDTENLWINVDGVYDVSPEMVAHTLDETIKSILNYCGGKVVEEGILRGS